MSRSTVFGLAVAAAIILIILTVLTWSGAIIGHKADGPAGLENFKHGVLFLILAIVAILVAAVSRPTSTVARP